MVGSYIEEVFKISKQNNYYVYRFINNEGIIVYVGRTINIDQRMKTHEHLTNDIKKIEYIICHSEAEMAWKEIYYINLFYNEHSVYVVDVYNKEKMPDINLKDIWKEYKSFSISQKFDVNEAYDKYLLNPPNYNYKKLIQIIDHKKLNSIGKSKHALSEKWFRDNFNNLKQLRNHIFNFYNNIISEAPTGKCYWTTYVQFYDHLKDKGYTKGYRYKTKYDTNRKYLAYIENNFYSVNENIELTQDQYALTCLLNFLFESDLKNGKPIVLYIPSSRMRKLLENWINNQNYGD